MRMNRLKRVGIPPLDLGSTCCYCVSITRPGADAGRNRREHPSPSVESLVGQWKETFAGRTPFPDSVGKRILSVSCQNLGSDEERELLSTKTKSGGAGKTKLRRQVEKPPNIPHNSGRRSEFRSTSDY